MTLQSSISIPLLLHTNYVDTYVQYNSMKRAHGMAQLNFPTIRLLHETYDKIIGVLGF
jgi:hypothetical protein